MTDRELLELAAKAAGIRPIAWGVQFDSYGWFCEPTGEHWNPLTDDGDGARLESALALDVRWQEHHVIVGRNYGDAWQEPFALHGGDKQAARRYAAVRSAAEIGKAVQKPLAL